MLIAAEAAELRPVLARLAAGATLSEADAATAFGVVLGGGATDAQIGGMLLAMRARGETVAELTGAAQAMRDRMLRVAAPAGAIDVCGTGGDMAATLNVSTAVTFVVAGAGVTVAKHGNRAASSRTGGADVLAALGVRLDPPMARLPAVLAQANCAFLFAPLHHPGLAHVAAVRRELGIRTIFNLLGPLANPAGVRRQLTGVFDPVWAMPMARTLAALGCARSWIVHGEGLDELTVAGPNSIVEQVGQSLRAFRLDATELGLARAPVAAIRGGEAAENAAAMLALLRREVPADGTDTRRRHDAYRDTVLLNSAAALVVAEMTDDVSAALDRARRALDDGSALAALDRLRAVSRIDA